MHKQEVSFFDSVYEIVRLIPEGRVTSYGAIAKALGSTGSSRMVGYAMNSAHSLTPPVPAQRVVNRNGLLTGKMHFSSPEDMQKRLEKDGLKVVADQIIDFKLHFWDPEEELKI